MQDQQLMTYFEFDEADLQANKNGQLSEKQKSLYVKEEKTDKTWNLVGGGCFILIGLIGIAGAIAAGAADPDLGFRIGFGFGFGFIWPLVWGAIAFTTLRSAFAKFQLKLQRVIGPVNFIKVERSSTIHEHTTHYMVNELHVGGQSFDVQQKLTEIMKEGDTYALYYTEGSDRSILSAELLSKAK